jgi:transcriptional regulator of acetoin/glycerol metabolism
LALAAYRAHGGNIKAAAQALGISRGKMYKLPDSEE